MAPPDPSYPMTARSGQCNKAEDQEKNVKTTFIKVIQVLKGKYLKEIQEKTNTTVEQSVNLLKNTKKKQRDW